MHATRIGIGSCLALILLAATPAASHPRSFKLLAVETDVCPTVPSGAQAGLVPSLPNVAPPAPPNLGLEGHQARDKFAAIHRLEAGAFTAREAMACKETGLKYVRSLSDFQQLVHRSFVFPSANYHWARSEFIVRNIAQLVAAEHGRGQLGKEPIQRILDLEALAASPSHAMAIKTAGLAFVGNKRDFYQLAAAATPLPDLPYLMLQSRFVTLHEGQWRE